MLYTQANVHGVFYLTHMRIIVIMENSQLLLRRNIQRSRPIHRLFLYTQLDASLLHCIYTMFLLCTYARTAYIFCQRIGATLQHQ